MEPMHRTREQQEARRQVDAFLAECEAYLREALEDEWIAAKAPDFRNYLWERLKEASGYGLEDKMLIMKYMTAAILTDDTDPQERADFSRLQRSLEGDTYDEAQLLNTYIQSYLEEETEDDGQEAQYPGQGAATDDILDELAVAVRSSIRVPFSSARLEVTREPGFVNFAGYFRNAAGEEAPIEDLLLDEAADDAVHRLYAIMAASGAEDWNLLHIVTTPDAAVEAAFRCERD